MALLTMLNDIKADNSTGASIVMAILGFAVFGVILFNWFGTSIRENHRVLTQRTVKAFICAGHVPVYIF